MNFLVAQMISCYNPFETKERNLIKIYPFETKKRNLIKIYSFETKERNRYARRQPIATVAKENHSVI